MTPSPPPPAPPDRATESAALLAGIVGRLGTPHVFVVGDLILDRYTWGDAERVSPEAPVLVLRSTRSEHRLGGAASVAFLLRALGARVTLAGVVGDDAAGATVRQLLNAAGVDCKPVVTDRTRPTTVKERFMGVAQHRHAHQILRVDHEAREPLAPETESELSRRLSGAVDDADAVLVSDYGKGVCTAGLIPGLISSARWANTPVLVDPARGADYERYRGATCVTPNRHEAEEAAGVSIRRPADAVTAARRLCRRHNLDAAVVTLDRDGMALARSDGRNGVYPARERRVYDITGAGDVVLSVLGVCLAAGVDFPEAIALANVAGGIEVESVGVAPVTWAEVLADLKAKRPADAKVLTREALVAAVEGRRRAGERVVFTNGCFDLLHPGHLRSLEDARGEGDCLVVGLNSDASVRRLKGPTRPVLPERERAAMVAALGAVDYVCVFDEDTPADLVAAVRPDVLVKGASYAAEEVAGREVVEGYGGRVVLGPLADGWSTSDLIRRIQQSDPAAV